MLLQACSCQTILSYRNEAEHPTVHRKQILLDCIALSTAAGPDLLPLLLFSCTQDLTVDLLSFVLPAPSPPMSQLHFAFSLVSGARSAYEEGIGTIWKKLASSDDLLIFDHARQMVDGTGGSGGFLLCHLQLRSTRTQCVLSLPLAEGGCF